MDARMIRAGFEENGYHVARTVFDAATIAELTHDFDRIVQQLHASGEDIDATWDSASAYAGATDHQIVHTHNVRNYSARWMAALQDPRLLDVVEAIVGPDIVLHHSKLFQKPAGEGSPFPMHQDWRYFPTRDDSMIAAIVHLTDATVDMGCVRVVPGSHRLGRVPSSSGRMIWDEPGEYQEFLAAHPIDDAVPIEAAPGDVLFFSYFTVHGSGPNLSSLPRKTVLAQLYSGSDELDPMSTHPVSGQVLRGWNHAATRESAASRA